MKILFKTIIRNFIRRPATNLINLLGLSISFTLVITLSVYCYSELTTDKFHTNGGRVYLYSRSSDKIYSPGILKETIDKSVPGVEATLRITGTWEVPVFQVENKEPITSDLLFADDDFFKFFSYTVVRGDIETSLKDPFTIVITETLAERLFGSDNVIGKTVKLNNKWDLTVRAIIKEPTANSCLSFSAVTSMSTQKIVQGQDGEYSEWGWMDFQTFLLLDNETNPVEVVKTIQTIIPEGRRDDFKDARLVPLSQIYFSKFKLYGSGYMVFGEKSKVLLLAGVAFLVLLIALVNFINITSTQWMKSIKQTGIMKIVGARRSNILINVLTESFLFFLASLLISANLVNSLYPFITEYTGIHFSPKMIYSPTFILISTAVVFILSLTFSIIPALRISSSGAIDNLKNSVKSEKINFSSNNLLVAVQFIIAIILIAFTTLVHKQILFGSDNPGFNKENIIGIKLTPQLNEKKEVFMKMLSDKASIAEVSMTQYYPGKDISEWGVEMDQKGEKKQLNFNTFCADTRFFKMMGLELVSGRLYSEDLSTDKDKIVVNETFVNEHNIIDPLECRFSMGNRTFEIIGIIKDFHFKPFNQPITPLAVRNESNYSQCLINLHTGSFKSIADAVEEIRATASEISPSFPVDVSFLDQAVEDMYQSELRFRRTFSLFAICSIVISCLGILAMSLFACQRRIKEIGIRKINGAKVTDIIIMLNKDFASLVCIAFIIATPLAWYAMHRWLLNYAYRTELSWWIFLMAGLMALGIALITVSWQSWRAATRNPVEALRYE